MAEFVSGWDVPPNGGAAYRLRLIVNVVAQDVAANTSTLAWGLRLEKDRSYNGFYLYNASWSATVNGATVVSGSGAMPPVAWRGWSAYGISEGTIVVAHNGDGTKTIDVGGAYYGANSGWAIGTVGFALPGAMVLPTIARATTPTVTPSPAVVGATVTIALPRALASFTHDVTWVSGNLSGTIGLALGVSATWTVPNVMGEFPGVSLAPIVITAVTKSGTTVLGSKQVSLFAKNPPPAPSILERNPSTQFDVRARVVSYSSGAWTAGRPIPADSIQMVDPASATATCNLSMSKLNSTTFADYSIIDIDTYNGKDWLFTNHRFVLSRVETDDADSALASSYIGTEFIDFQMGFAYTQKDYEFIGSNPGAIMATLIADAKARGWGPRVDHAFTAGLTSLGETWANPIPNRKVSKGTPISQVLDGLVTDGLVEYRTEYHSNKALLVLLNPGTGSNFGEVGSSPVVNLSLLKISRAPRRGSIEKRLTRVTVTGDDTIQVTREKTAFDANVFGQMEGWVSASGVADAGAANVIGDNALRDNSSAVSERTFEFEAQNASPQYYPYSVYRSGDWLLIPDGDNSVVDRISQVTINKTGDGALSLTVLTGDRILNGTASLAKRQSAQTGGSIGGGNGQTPSPLDSRIPASPVVNAITSLGYWNTDGAAKSAVTMSWVAVGEAMNGSAINVDLYEVWSRPSNVDAEWTFRSATAQTSIEMGDWDVLKLIDLRVRARSVAGIYGEFSEDQAHTTLAPAVDLSGPQIADLYTDGVGNVFVVWGGLLGTSPAPARLAYVGAEVSTDGGATYVATGTPIVAAGTIVLNLGIWGDYLVRLRGYDRLGNAGTASAPMAITLTDPHIDPSKPLPPTALTATAGAAWDASGYLPSAWFNLAWTAPTLDVNGALVDIVGYDVWGLRSTETIERYLTSSSTNSVRIKVGNSEEWSFRVRAASNFGGVSDPSTVVTATANATISATTAPAAPVLAQYAGLLRIQWAGVGMVPHTKYVYAEIATSAVGVFTRAGMPLNGAGEIVVPGLATATNYWARIVMVDELGQTSTSAAAGPIHLDPITGVTIQTSSVANTGIKMTSGSLTAYDVSGNPTFILDANTGAVWIAPYDAVFELGASGTGAETGTAVTGIAISSNNSSFNTFIHSSGVQIRNDQTALSWWEPDAEDASLVNFFSPRAVIGQRLRIADYEMLREAKAIGSRLVTRYKGD